MNALLILKLAMVLSIVLILFALSLRAKREDLLYLFTHWRLGLGAFIAMFVVVPALAIFMAKSFDLNPAVKVALVAIAFSPLPPILPGKQLKAGGDGCYITGLLFGATVVSVLVAPFGVALAGSLFHVEAGITPGQVAKPLVMTVILPLLLGLGAAPMLGTARLKVADIASKLGSAILLVVLVVLLVLMFPAIKAVIGEGTLLVLAVLIVGGLIAGYALGGFDRGDRATLALAASTRHPGVAVAIASATFPEAKLAPAAIVLSLLLSTVLCIPFMKRMKMLTANGE
ncbi:bile acid:sodium symporter [Novosphingobium sp. YJ-S2-02]|uniref:Bile acid:sodium symporter n=1 Tax=Novosphingobium aureum TaxID=2792964 RepID=A0A931HES2_9SPHN|nr:bile acid:sodium symporter [Novosphingobium aureum]MBH0114044.1 bile acid:sodium symporter [Novosphingobium aureum]